MVFYCIQASIAKLQIVLKFNWILNTHRNDIIFKFIFVLPTKALVHLLFILSLITTSLIYEIYQQVSLIKYGHSIIYSLGSRCYLSIREEKKVSLLQKRLMPMPNIEKVYLNKKEKVVKRQRLIGMAKSISFLWTLPWDSFCLLNVRRISLFVFSFFRFFVFYSKDQRLFSTFFWWISTSRLSSTARK